MMFSQVIPAVNPPIQQASLIMRFSNSCLTSHRTEKNTKSSLNHMTLSWFSIRHIRSSQINFNFLISILLYVTKANFKCKPCLKDIQFMI